MTPYYGTTTSLPATFVITLPKTMSDTNYKASATINQFNGYLDSSKQIEIDVTSTTLQTGTFNVEVKSVTGNTIQTLKIQYFTVNSTLKDILFTRYFPVAPSKNITSSDSYQL